MRGPNNLIDIDPDHSHRRGIPAWSLSAGFHVLLVMLVALLPNTPLRRAEAVPDRPAGIALVQRNAADVDYLLEDVERHKQSRSSEDDSDSELADQPIESIVDALPSISQIGGSAAVDLPSVAGIERATVGALPSATGLTLGGERQSRALGEQASTQVFGVQGQGSKFIYVFDRSASMQGFQGRPMAAARRQLLASLQDLSSVHQFQIVYYNDRASVFNPSRPRPPRLMFATEENKRLAKQFVSSIEPSGATRHMQALRIALNLTPDVIFFLTDAAEPQLTAGELDEIRRRNRSGTVIHTIEFGSGPSSTPDNFLRRLAVQNDGKHVYVDVTSLVSWQQRTPMGEWCLAMAQTFTSPFAVYTLRPCSFCQG